MMASLSRLIPAVVLFVSALLVGVGAHAADPVVAPDASGAADSSLSTERVQVSAPYIELHTGPGRGFPVFFVVSRHDWIEIELRHTDWFKVRTATGQVGWVVRQQLESTLTEAGVRKGFRDILIDDYLGRRVQLGAAWGHFNSEPMLKLWTNYRLTDTLSVEGTVGQVQGKFSGTDFWHVNLMIEPWSDQRISPFGTIGLGKFKDVPNASLVSAQTTHAKLAHAAVGVNYHLSDRFLVRADYGLHTVFLSDTRTVEYGAWTLGLAFFF